MNVLLTTINSKYIHQNLAIGLLYELNKAHEGLCVCEFNAKVDRTEMVSYCTDFQIVAFSCYIWNIKQILEVAASIKQINPACKILLGGPEVSFEWNEIIALPEIDYIIVGEGEIPFSSFLKNYPDVNQVPGLVWKENGTIVENKPSDVFDLQQLNGLNPYSCIPAEELKHKICYIEASRGCPNTCGFCLAGLYNNLRYLPIDVIQTNLLYLMENGRTIKFLDRTFNTHPAFAISVFQFILDHYKPGNVFQFEIKADIFQKELIAFIQENVTKGVFRFEIGIQTLNAESNQEVKRRQNFDNIKAFIEQVADKVEIHLDLIVGLPHDYLSDIQYSFEEVFKIFAPELQLGFLKFLKGTPIRQNYRLHNYRFDTLPPYQIIESKYLSKKQIEDIMLLEHVLDVYWNKKRALNTLKYVATTYSSFSFLQDLGLYWAKKNGLQNTGLIDIYVLLFEFSEFYYPDDELLIELIALDYYMQHKIKPAIRFLKEISKTEHFEMCERLKLNHHKYRYVMHQVHFSLYKFVNQGVIEPSCEMLIIEYSGVEKPRIILHA